MGLLKLSSWNSTFVANVKLLMWVIIIGGSFCTSSTLNFVSYGTVLLHCIESFKLVLESCTFANNRKESYCVMPVYSSRHDYNAFTHPQFYVVVALVFANESGRCLILVARSEEFFTFQFEQSNSCYRVQYILRCAWILFAIQDDTLSLY